MSLVNDDFSAADHKKKDFFSFYSNILIIVDKINDAFSLVGRDNHVTIRLTKLVFKKSPSLHHFSVVISVIQW